MPPMASPEVAWIGDQCHALAEASISVLDLGFLRGLGIFETLRTYGGHPHAVDAHLARLDRSAAELGIACPLDAATLRQRIATSTTANPGIDYRVNIIITPGSHTHGVFGADQPSVVILMRVLEEPPANWYSDGVAVVTFRGSRVHPEQKTTAYITGRAGLQAAAAVGAHEALYLSADDELSEGVTSNVILVRDGELLSPSAPSLSGITRTGIIAVAAEAGIKHRPTALHREDLFSADEIWICSSVRELVPVVSVDGQQIGDGSPGSLAKTIGTRYRQQVRDEACRDAGKGR